MSELRPAAVAGYFYPGSARELRPMVEDLLGRAEQVGGRVFAKAIIAPHAGFIYSGPTAGWAFRQLAPDAGGIRRIVLLGPAHRVPVRGLALPDAARFATPLGTVAVDRGLVEELGSLEQVTVSGAAHAPEHSLEVELPFLQVVLEEFTILPLLVSRLAPEAIAEVLDRVWGGEETRVVVSSDLSHYLDYRSAVRVDRETADRILDLEEVAEERACGAAALNGLLLAARRRGLAPRLLDLRNSGDTAGDRSRVVGYGAFAFTEPS